MKLPDIHSSAGFTLIELLVVVSIMVGILSLGVASYNSFASTQVLDGATKTLRANLRLAQSFAVNGEVIKDSSCTSGTPPPTFNGYYFVMQDGGSSYSLGEYCGNPSGTTYNIARTPPSPVNLPPGVTITSIKSGAIEKTPLTILFQSIRGAVFYNCTAPSLPCYTVPVSGDITIQLTSGSSTRSLVITSDGKIQ